MQVSIKLHRRAVTFCACTLLALSVPSVCLAEEVPTSDEVVASEAETQDQLQAMVADATSTDQSATGGQSTADTQTTGEAASGQGGAGTSDDGASVDAAVSQNPTDTSESPTGEASSSSSSTNPTTSGIEETDPNPENSASPAQAEGRAVTMSTSPTASTAGTPSTAIAQRINGWGIEGVTCDDPVAITAGDLPHGATTGTATDGTKISGASLTAAYLQTITVSKECLLAQGTDACKLIESIMSSIYSDGDTSGATLYHVVLPAGTYVLPTILHIYSNTWLDLSAGTTFVRGFEYGPLLRGNKSTNTADAYSLISNVCVQGGTWDANSASYKTRATATMRFGHGHDILVSGCTFIGCLNSHMIELAGDENVTIEGCTFRDSTGGELKEAIQLEPINNSKATPTYANYDDTICYNIVIANNTFQNVNRGVGSHYSVKGVYNDLIMIAGNIFREVINEAIALPSCRRFIISGNVIQDCGAGILIESVNPSLKTPVKSGWRVTSDAQGSITSNTIWTIKKGSTGHFGISLCGRKVGGVSYPLSGIAVANNQIVAYGTPILQALTSAIAQRSNVAVKIVPNSLMEVSGEKYYFKEDGRRGTGWISIGNKRYYIDPKTFRAARWAQTIGGKHYYFDGSYAMVTGWVTWNSDKTRSYFGSDGAALSGWQTVGGKRYYFDPTNWDHGYRWAHTMGGKYYYFDSDCHMWTGWLTWNADKSRSYFDADSASDGYGAALSGWQTVGGKRYYFDPKNSYHGLRWAQTVDGKYYYFDGSCAMQKGWVTWNSDKTRSYFGSDGAALSGWQTVGGRRYYFDSKNSYHGLRWVQTLDGKMYYFDSDCHMWTGWLTWVADKSRSYFGADGAAVSGWKDDGAKRYYISPSTLHTVRWLQTIDGKEYYFDGDYTMHTGWVTWNADKSRSYFDPDSASATHGAALSGWRNDGAKRYYISPSTLHTVRWRYDVGGGRLYYFQGDYSLVTRQWIQFKDTAAPSWADSEGLLTQVPSASLDSSGKLKGAKPGWLFLGSDRFYIKSDGTPYTQWMTAGSNRYWFMKQTGVAAEGVLQIYGAYYYFKPDTQAMQTGWQTVGTHTYYFDPSTGKAATSSRKVDGKMHYFDTNGWEFTALQLKLIQAAKKTPTTPAGYCSEWISNVFRNAGIASFDGDACDQYRWYCHSSDRSELRAGMIVAVSKHSNTRLGRIYGHVCLYIGDGKIMDSIGRVRTMNLQPWLDHYGNMVTPKWGWGGDVALA